MRLARTPAARTALQTARRIPTTHTATSSPALLLLSRHLHLSTAPLRPAALRTIKPTTALPTIRHGSSSSSSDGPLAKTPLYDLHLANSAKMVPFGGFHMPVQYPSLSVSASHVFTREHASIFDVSHMVQRIFSGPGAAAFLERVTPSGVAALELHRSTLSCLMGPDGKGGIVDDTIITRLPGEKFYVVTNAACREKDDGYFQAEMEKWNGEKGEGMEVRQEQLGGWGLVALQGPEAAEVLGKCLDEGSGVDLRKVLFGQSVYARVKMQGMEVSSGLLISRGGYTGEDGFEISIPAEETVAVTEALLAAGGKEKVQLAGLGARDSLRLEAGMCLYGHDLDESTTPVEAGLSWIIPKERRTADAGYYGAEVLAGQVVLRSKGGTGVRRRRVGLIVEGAPAREGAEIVSRPEEGGEAVKLGTVTSGCPSPTLGKNIAMGYVKDGFHKAGTEVGVVVRGRVRKAVVTKMPFVPTKYWKGDS
ncbi:hypothetical protein QBC34DRAFT_90213 [Podospora aff. communis PSN243]|uniref:Aminomethyltransferase n=1 Tax=Podospora aff. communis PSN243 TaxID=3040156 RepID=A0AAV9GPZ7_9PEZI|nr:hypothetical protein QBC34DRAFT_90213 [Podospora aff. communis PSN243]